MLLVRDGCAPGPPVLEKRSHTGLETVVHTNLVLGPLVLGEAIALTVPICKFRSLDLGERKNALQVNIQTSTVK